MFVTPARSQDWVTPFVVAKLRLPDVRFPSLSNDTTAYPAEMSEYFRSIDRPFEETLASKQKDDSNFLGAMTAVCGFAIAISVLPVIPAVMYLVAPRLARVSSFSVFRLTVPLNSFKLWWPVCVVASVLAMWIIVSLSNSRSRGRKKTWLPEQQLRFALCYKVVEELRSYERNNLPLLADSALEHWRKLRPYLLGLFNPVGGPLVRQTSFGFADLDPGTIEEMQRMGLQSQAGFHSSLSLFPQVSTLRVSHPWFRVTPETGAIMEGINGIFDKIDPRIRKREAAGKIADCLEQLCGYLYSLIHGISGRPVNDWGLAQLAGFAACVNAMPGYLPERKSKKADTESEGLKGAQTKVAVVTQVFMHQNLLICFVAWYALFELLVVLAMVIAFKVVPGLKMDSVMVTSLIAAPILGAAAVVAVSKARAK